MAGWVARRTFFAAHLVISFRPSTKANICVTQKCRSIDVSHIRLNHDTFASLDLHFRHSA